MQKMFAVCHSHMGQEPEFFSLQARAHVLSSEASEAFWTARYIEYKTAFVDSMISLESPEHFQAMVSNATMQITAMTRDEPLTGCGKFFLNYKKVNSLVSDVTSLCRASCLVNMGPTGQKILACALAKFS